MCVFSKRRYKEWKSFFVEGKESSIILKGAGNFKMGKRTNRTKLWKVCEEKNLIKEFYVVLKLDKTEFVTKVFKIISTRT